MADFTQAAQQDTQAQQQALLAAIAQEGSAGRATLQAAQQQAQGQQTQAVNDAISRATGMNAPGGLEQQLAQQAAQPDQLSGQLLGQMGQQYDQNMGALSTANKDYMDQVSAAVPVVQARTDAQVAQIKAQQEEAAKQRALQQQIAQMQLEQEQARLQQVQSGANGGLSVSDMLNLQQYKDKQDAAANQAQSQKNQQAYRTNVISSLSPQAQSAFDQLAANDSLSSALSDLGGLQGTTDSKGNPLTDQNGKPITQFQALFGNIDPNELRALLTDYYGGETAANAFKDYTVQQVQRVAKSLSFSGS